MLAVKLKTIDCLTGIEMRRIGECKNGLEDLLIAIKQNRPILELDIRDINLNGMIIKEILDALKENYVLRSIRFTISGNITLQILNNVSDLELLYLMQHE